MEVRIICIGKIKDKNLQALINSYQTKINKFHKFEIIVLNEITFNCENEKIIKEILNKEARLIEPYLENSFNIALTIEGELWSSEILSKQIAHIFNYQSHLKYLNFIIGSSYGIDQSIKDKVQLNFSLGRITLNHQLARLILLEQIYRSFTIIHHIKYHK